MTYIRREKKIHDRPKKSHIITSRPRNQLRASIYESSRTHSPHRGPLSCAAILPKRAPVQVFYLQRQNHHESTNIEHHHHFRGKKHLRHDDGWGVGWADSGSPPLVDALDLSPEAVLKQTAWRKVSGTMSQGNSPRGPTRCPSDRQLGWPYNFFLDSARDSTSLPLVGQ